MKEKIKKLITGFYKDKNLKKQLPVMLIGVFMMGFTLSWLRFVNWGTDPFSNMNIAISEKLGLTLGTWTLILNVILFVIVIILGADNIGFGTVANMTLIGYICDFFTWIWKKILPAKILEYPDVPEGTKERLIIPHFSNEYLWLRIAVMIVALALFVFFAAIYMDAGLGVSPCDAIPLIIWSKIPKAPMKAVRMAYDTTVILIAVLFGSPWYIVTILMALTLGPTIEFVGKHIKKWFSLVLVLAVFSAGLMANPLKSYAMTDEEQLEYNKNLEVQSNETANWPQGPIVGAESAILIEAESGVIHKKKNIHFQEYPASTTKILTCLIAAERCENDEIVSFSHDAVFDTPRDSNNIAIDQGEEMTVYECLQAILIRSANECAFAVAEHIAGGHWSEFAKIMNERAAELGCMDSNFVNPNGLPDDNHFTSAYDLAMIGREFFKNEMLCEITLSPRLHIYPSAKQKDEIIENSTNQMLEGKKYEYKNLVGAKTGYTEAAGSCLVSCAEKDGIRLICVVMNDVAPNQYLDTIALFDYGFSNFDKINISEKETKYNISTKGSFYTGVDVLGNSQPILSLNKNDFIMLPKTVDFEDIESEISYNTQKKEQAAIIKYTYHGRTLGTASVDFAVVDENGGYKFDEEVLPDSVAAEKEEPEEDEEEKIVFINIVKIGKYVLIVGASIGLIYLIVKWQINYHRKHPNWRANWRRERRKKRSGKYASSMHSEAMRHKAELKAERKRRTKGRKRVNRLFRKR